MSMFRRKADRIIDGAHCAIAGAEMRMIHSYTEEQIMAADDEMMVARRFLVRAIAARDAWDASDHDDYEEYPEVPEGDGQLSLL